MGTEENTPREELVAEIRRAFSVMGLSQNQGASRLYDVLHPESDDDEEAKRFVATFKKQMTRDSTPLEVLERYLVALQEFREFRNAGLHYLRPLPIEHLPDELSEELQKISKEIHNLVKSGPK